MQYIEEQILGSRTSFNECWTIIKCVGEAVSAIKVLKPDIAYLGMHGQHFRVGCVHLWSA